MTNTTGRIAELEGIDDSVIDAFALDKLPFDDCARPVRDLVDLTGKVVAVTGGGGGSLGKALVNRFASAGAQVVVLDLDAEAAENVAATWGERWGVSTLAMRCDITDWDEIHRVLRRAADELGSLDVLVNNAGGALRSHGRFIDQSPETISRIIDVNFLGTLYATRAALDVMLPQGSGRIVNIASEGGKTTVPGLTVYNSCKSGVIGFTRNLAEDLRGTGVSTVAVCPGVMVGPHALERMRGGSTAASRRALEYTMQELNIGRFSLPEEVATMALVVSTPAGAYLSGTAVSVGGGMTD